MKKQEMLEKRAGYVARAQEILDGADAANRVMTDEENQQFGHLMDQAEGLTRVIEAGGGEPLPRKVEPFAPREGLDHAPVNRFAGNEPRIEVVTSGVKLQAFQNTVRGQETAHRMGMWLKATLLQDPIANQWCISNGLRPDVMMAAATSPNTLGGALVPDEMSRTIISLVEQYGVIRANADVVPMSGTTLDIPRRTGGVTAYFAGEGETVDESDITWDNVQLNCKKVMVLSRMSSEINEDAIISFADRFAFEIALAFAAKEDACGLNGTGASTYGGMVGVLVKAIDGSHGKAKVAAASGHDTMAEIDSDDMLKLMSAIPRYAKRGAAWYCSPEAEAMIINALKLAGGGNTASTLAAAQMPSFLGYPVITSVDMADDIAATYNGEVILAFGNLRQAVTMGARRDIRVQLSTDVYFDTDEIGVKGTERFDIVAHDLGSDTVKSPFAVLVGTT